MKVRGKEYKLNSKENYTVKLGTFNNLKPTCFYFNIKGWTTPKGENEENFGQVVKMLNKRIKNKLFNVVDGDKFQKEIIIVDLDLRSSGIKYGKKSYFNCEVTMYQKETVPLLGLTDTINDITNNLITEVLEEFEYLNFTKKK